MLFDILRTRIHTGVHFVPYKPYLHTDVRVQSKQCLCRFICHVVSGKDLMTRKNINDTKASRVPMRDAEL